MRVEFRALALLHGRELEDDNEAPVKSRGKEKQLSEDQERAIARDLELVKKQKAK